MRRLAIVFVATALISCATPYQEMGMMGGVSASPMGGDVWRISARGNAYTDPSRVQDFVFLRAAETALENGYSYFAILDAEDRTRSSTYTAPSTAQTTSNATAYGNSYGNTATVNAYGSSTTTYYPGQTHVYVRPGQDVMVRFFLEDPEGVLFDANDVYSAIAPRYFDMESE